MEDRHRNIPASGTGHYDFWIYKALTSLSIPISGSHFSPFVSDKERLIVWLKK